MSQSQHDVVISGLGFRCSVGQNVVQSCASIRAGIDRFAAWPHMTDASDPDAAGIVAAAISPDLGDESWVAKFRQLAEQPLLEALWEAKLYDLSSQRMRTALYLAVPLPERHGSQESLANFSVDLAEPNFLPVTFNSTFLFPKEHVGGFIAVNKAVEDLASDAFDVCIVGGVDSLLHSQHLLSLVASAKLKVYSVPAGRIPGEAAAFIVLEKMEQARRRGAKVLARLAKVSTATDSCLGQGKPTRGEALSETLQEALSNTPYPPGRISRVMADLNGERSRFLEWGLAYGRALSSLPPKRELWHPADCIGDIGAATGPAFICIATRAFERGYAGGDAVILSTASDSGERAALSVLTPQAQGS